MNITPLNQLPKGAHASIHKITINQVFGQLDDMIGRRLVDLGFSDGVSIQIIGTGLFGRGPFAVRVGNCAQFSLREAEAAKVLCLLPDTTE
ncbi:MAG: FeoA family protein [Neisseria sp.]|mgnify:FL=1